MNKKQAIITISSIICIIIIILLSKTNYSAKLINFYWERETIVEKYRTDKDDGWSRPYDAFNVTTSYRIHHYDNIYGNVVKHRADGSSYTSYEKIGEEPVYQTYYHYDINRWCYHETLQTDGIEQFNQFWPEFTPEKAGSNGLGATRIKRKNQYLYVNMEWFEKEKKITKLFKVDSYKGKNIGDTAKVYFVMGISSGI